MEELPIRYFDTHYHGDIMSTYTNDIDTLRQMISQSMPQFLNSIITIVSVFVSMLLLNVPLTIVTLLMIGVTLFATKRSAHSVPNTLSHSRKTLQRSMVISKK